MEANVNGRGPPDGMSFGFAVCGSEADGELPDLEGGDMMGLSQSLILGGRPQNRDFKIPSDFIRREESFRMQNTDRRTFGKQTLGTLLTFSLLEALHECDALAEKVKPITTRWLADVNQLGLDLKGEKIKQADWQQKLEELLSQASIGEILELVDFEKLTKNLKFVDNGVRSLRFDFRQIEGVPENFAYGKQIFAFKKGRSVVPHGHNNMATAFLILNGKFRGRHYDRVQDEDKHILIKPTIDRAFTVAEYSTVTDVKDNVHWFQAESKTGFIFNIHALNVNPGSSQRTGRVYVDPNGEKLKDGLIRAPRINHDLAHKLYG